MPVWSLLLLFVLLLMVVGLSMGPWHKNKPKTTLPAAAPEPLAPIGTVRIHDWKGACRFENKDGGTFLSLQSPEESKSFFESRGVRNDDSLVLQDSHTCRENFAHDFKENTAWIAFARGTKMVKPLFKNSVRVHVKIDVEAFCKAIHGIEKSLGVKPEEYTQVFKTDMRSVMVLKVSTFWLKYITRRSLFTILLRGLVLHRDLKTMLWRYKHASQTSEAIKWFLSGNTLPIFDNAIGEGGGRGWVYFFASYQNHPNMLKEVLVKPSN